MIRRSVVMRSADVGALQLDDRLAPVGQHAGVHLADRRRRQRPVVEALEELRRRRGRGPCGSSRAPVGAGERRHLVEAAQAGVRPAAPGRCRATTRSAGRASRTWARAPRRRRPGRWTRPRPTIRPRRRTSRRRASASHHRHDHDEVDGDHAGQLARRRTGRARARRCAGRRRAVRRRTGPGSGRRRRWRRTCRRWVRSGVVGRPSRRLWHQRRRRPPAAASAPSSAPPSQAAEVAADGDAGHEEREERGSPPAASR